MAARTLGAVGAVVCAAMLAGCTATTDGAAVKAPGGGGEAIVALMDTGSYRTTPAPPPGNAGTDRLEAGHAEAERMAPYVVGPWQVDASLATLDFLASAPLSAPFNAGTALSYPITGDAFAQRMTDVTAAHGFIAGLTTGRTGLGDVARLQNAVLRFPDADAAGAAARELAAVVPDSTIKPVMFTPDPTADDRPLTGPWQPGACGDFATSPTHPDAAVSAGLGNQSVVRSFTAHGAYVLYQFVIAKTPSSACVTAVQAVTSQEALIDRFVPTDPAKLGELPKDPSGQLAARTLSGASTRTPFSAGVWQPDGWLHFEPAQPGNVQSWLTAAGVHWVSQDMTRVYEARDAAGAGQLVDRFADDTQGLSGVEPTSAGVPGFPGAKCFARPSWHKYTAAIMVANTSVYWHFACIGQAGHYAFMAFSDEERDVKQQLSAQYRILAGE